MELTHDVPLDVRGACRMEQLDRPVAVDGELALGPAARSGPGREDHGIGAADRPGQFFRAGTLQVADDGFAAVGAEVVGVSWIPDHATDAVAPTDEQAGEAPGDLAVASDDDDVHGSQPQRPLTAASTVRSRLRSACSTTGARGTFASGHRDPVDAWVSITPRCGRSR